MDLRVVAADRAAIAVTDTFSLVVDLDGPIEVEPLSTAWALVGHRYPILRAHLLHEADATWALQPELDPIVVVSDDHERPGMYPGLVEQRHVTYERQLTETGLWKLVVIRRPIGDRLVFTGHHAHMDGSSFIAILATLADYYGQIRAGVVPRPTPDDQTRCIGDLLSDTDIRLSTQAQVMARFVRRWNALPVSTHVDPCHPSEPGWAAADITDAMPIVAALRRAHGWRTGAVLLALVARAWSRVFPGAAELGADGWQVAFDLRSELDRATGIGNFSTTEPITLWDVGRSDVAELMADANRTFGGLTSTWPGLGAALGALQLGTCPPPVVDAAMERAVSEVAHRRHGRSFSNVGQLPAITEQWGSARATGAVFVPRLASADMTTIACTSIGGSTHIAMRTQSVGLRRNDIEKLGFEIRSEAKALQSL